MTYVVVTVAEIHKPELLDQYVARFMPVLRKFEGTLVAVDEDVEIKEGDWAPLRTVILAFPSAELARQWYESAEYRGIAQLRQDAATVNLVFVRGLDEAAATIAA